MEKELVETRQVLSTAAVTESDADADPAVSGRVGTKMTVITSRESVHTGVPILNRVRLRSIPSIADSVLVVALTTIRPECQPLPKGRSDSEFCRCSNGYLSAFGARSKTARVKFLQDHWR